MKYIEYIEMIAIMVGICMAVACPMREYFRPGFYRCTKQMTSALWCILFSSLAFDFIDIGIIRIILTFMVATSGIMAYLISSSNYITIEGNKLIISNDGKVTALDRQDVSIRYEREGRVLVIGGKGEEVRTLNANCEKLEEWPGVQR